MSLPTSTAVAAAAPQVTSTSGGSWFILVILTLLVITIAVVLWVYRRRLNFGAADPHIKILSTRFIGPREKIMVVDVYGRHLVLGQTPAQISLLCELDASEMPTESSAQALPSDFSKVISRFIRPEGGA